MHHFVSDTLKKIPLKFATSEHKNKKKRIFGEDGREKGERKRKKKNEH